MEREPTADGASAPSPDPTPDSAPGAAAVSGQVPRDGSPTADADPAPAPPAAVGDRTEQAAAADTEGSTSTGGAGSRRGWSRPTAAVATAALTVALGFALTTQVRSTADPEDQVVRREEDLVFILDETNAREETLRQQIAETRQTVENLSSGQQQAGSALEEARSRAEAIGILAGTLPATGPGLRMSIQDPDAAVPTSVVLGAIQELRGAGAEAIQVDDVRIVVSSAVTGSPGELRIDGQPLRAPYDFRAVGPPAAMDVALNVPGGVVDDVGRVGGEAEVEQLDSVVVDATVD